ncbi:MAG: TetR/AcrR family transcriptional regulator [Bdellovibrionales bacterium]|nr:TetR/AcrR family transcriptional regulator [Bdellovibrionales bacterium]
MGTKTERSLSLSPTNSPSSKEQLLAAAIKLFAEKGFEAVTVREVAREANINFGLIRYYFTDKTGLYRACIQKYGQTRLDSARRFLEPATSLADFKLKLRYAIEDIIEAQLQDPSLTKLALREVESENSIADDIFRDTLIVMAKSFIRFFADAQKKGFMNSAVDPGFLTHSIQGIINHLVRTDSIRAKHFNFSVRSTDRRKKIAEDLYQLILNGILK